MSEHKQAFQDALDRTDSRSRPVWMTNLARCYVEATQLLRDIAREECDTADLGYDACPECIEPASDWCFPCRARAYLESEGNE